MRPGLGPGPVRLGPAKADRKSAQFSFSESTLNVATNRDSRAAVSRTQPGEPGRTALSDAGGLSLPSLTNPALDAARPGSRRPESRAH